MPTPFDEYSIYKPEDEDYEDINGNYYDRSLEGSKDFNENPVETL